MPPQAYRIWSLNRLPGETSLISSEEIIMPFRNQFSLGKKCIAAIILNMGWSPCKITEPDFNTTLHFSKVSESWQYCHLCKRDQEWDWRILFRDFFHQNMPLCADWDLTLPGSWSLQKASLGNRCPAFQRTPNLCPVIHCMHGRQTPFLSSLGTPITCTLLKQNLHSLEFWEMNFSCTRKAGTPPLFPK